MCIYCVGNGLFEYEDMRQVERKKRFCNIVRSALLTPWRDMREPSALPQVKLLARLRYR